MAGKRIDGGALEGIGSEDSRNGRDGQRDFFVSFQKEHHDSVLFLLRSMTHTGYSRDFFDFEYD